MSSQTLKHDIIFVNISVKQIIDVSRDRIKFRHITINENQCSKLNNVLPKSFLFAHSMPTCKSKNSHSAYC